MKQWAPPTLNNLLEDPVYRAYVKRVPFLPENLRHGSPWAVWAQRTNGRWAGGMFATYADAWRVVVKAVRSENVRDVALVSRRWLFSAPEGFVWDDRTFEWCGRCRRPTTFVTQYTHHALKGVPLSEEDPRRCYYCGVRKAFSS